MCRTLSLSVCAEHLDFDYAWNDKNQPDGANGTNIEKRDVRLRRMITDLQWPLIHEHKCIVPAGTAVLCSHNVYHRATRRLDDDSTWKERPRYMWRMWCYRTTEPEPNALPASAVRPESWGVHSATGVDLSHAPDSGTRAVWEHHIAYLAGRSLPDLPGNAAALAADLQAKGIPNEAVRVGAAYRIARMADKQQATAVLMKGLFSYSESIRRAAGYGLAALGPAATASLLSAFSCPAMSIRKYAVFAAGEVAPLAPEVLAALRDVLEHDDSVYVRHCAANALGCIAIRALAGTREHCAAGTGSSTTVEPLLCDLVADVRTLSVTAISALGSY
eukprot:COSAG03_NODE_134_length_11903_cov_30.799729_9_plen_332_part_00